MNIFSFWSFLLGAGSMLFLFFGVNSVLMGVGYLFEYSLLGGLSSLSFCLVIDWVGSFFLGVVFFISSLVLFYSKSYMSEDLNQRRFCALVVMFVCSMGFLVLSPNLVSLLLGWDGLGLISYCLVIFYQNSKSYNSGMLTVLMNRIGDVGILLGIALLASGGSWNFVSFAPGSLGSVKIMLLSLILMAAMTSSAQVPFSSWLPAAMAAPTPVSALVHSSTLVTAGVFLLIRFYDQLSEDIKGVLMLVSLLTLLLGGLGACFEMDFKKVIALSTLSQLGLMMFTLSLGLWEVAYFHMLTHALFKSLLFLCAGFLIHNMFGSQDIRLLGCLVSSTPMVSLGTLLSFLSLCGFPFTCGFYSKDMILECYLLGSKSMVVCLSFFFGVFLTVLYSMRLVYYMLLYEYMGVFESLVEEDSSMNLALLVLVVVGVMFGGLVPWLILDFNGGIYLSLFFSVMTLSIVLAIFYYFLVIFGSKKSLASLRVFYPTQFFSSMWFLTYVGSFISVYLGAKISTNLVSGDLSWNELAGGSGSSLSLKSLISVLQGYHYNILNVQLGVILALMVVLILF